MFKPDFGAKKFVWVVVSCCALANPSPVFLYIHVIGWIGVAFLAKKVEFVSIDFSPSALFRTTFVAGASGCS